MSEETQVIQKQETTEVVAPVGMPPSSTVESLGNLFDKIEAGKSEGKTTKEIIAEPATAQPEKKEEKKDEKQAAPVQSEKKEAPEKEPAASLEEEFSRESLRKGLQKKEEPAKTETEKAAQETEEVPEEELKVLPNDKPKTAKRIQAFLKKIETLTGETTKTKKEAEEKAAKLAEYEKKLAEVQSVDPKTNTEIKEKLDELAMLRRRYELDSDPEVKTKFDSRVEQAEKTITDVLVRRNANKALLDLIQGEGGWNGFSNSNRQIPISDGEGGIKYAPAAEVAEEILKALPLGERKAVEAAMMEQVQTKRDRERFYKEEQTKANEFFQSREAQAKKVAEEQQKQVAEARKQIDEYVNKTMGEEWMADKKVPENATAAQRTEIEEHNAYNKQLRGILKKAVGTKDLNGLLEIITDSVRYFDERRRTASLEKEVSRLNSEIKAKQAELDKFKSSGRSVPRGGSIATTPTDDSTRTRAPMSLEETLERMERGERFNGSKIITSDE